MIKQELSRRLRRPSQARPPQGGFVLLESLLAVLVFSLGILALIGVQAAAIRLGGESKQRSEAIFIASQIEADLWGLAPSLLSTCAATIVAGGSPGCVGDWPGRLESLPNGKAVIGVADTAVTLTISWKAPGEEDEHSYIHKTEIAKN